MYGIERLAARIHELQGCVTVAIHREEKFDEMGHKYTKYWVPHAGYRQLLRNYAAPRGVLA